MTPTCLPVIQKTEPVCISNCDNYFLYSNIHLNWSPVICMQSWFQGVCRLECECTGDGVIDIWWLSFPSKNGNYQYLAAITHLARSGSVYWGWWNLGFRECWRQPLWTGTICLVSYFSGQHAPLLSGILEKGKWRTITHCGLQCNILLGPIGTTLMNGDFVLLHLRHSKIKCQFLFTIIHYNMIKCFNGITHYKKLTYLVVVSICTGTAANFKINYFFRDVQITRAIIANKWYNIPRFNIET